VQLDLARTSGVWRRVIHNSGDHSTGVASVYAQECARDKPVFHVALSAGRCLLVGLWRFIELAASDPVERNIIGSYVHNAICKGEVWEIIEVDKWVRKTSGKPFVAKARTTCRRIIEHYVMYYLQAGPYIGLE